MHGTDTRSIPVIRQPLADDSSVFPPPPGLVDRGETTSRLSPWGRSLGRPPRVVHISKVAGIAGSERHLLTLLPRLASSGIETSMIVLEEPARSANVFCRALRAAGVDVAVETIANDVDPTLLPRLVRRLRASGADLVHTHLVHADCYGLTAARLAGVPQSISSRHNNDAFRRRRLFKWLNRYVMAGATRVVTVSRALARFVAEVEGIDRARIASVHYGLDPDFARIARPDVRATLEIDDSTPVVGVVARFVQQKGVDVLLDAFQDVRRQFPSARLLVVGEGPLEGALRTRIRETALQDAVTLTGWVAEGRSLMPACDVIAIPSRWEGFGLTALEAMACSLPVVASRVDALPEIVADGHTGLLVPPEDVPALSGALTQVLADRARARAMGEAGYARLVADFSVERMVAATLTIYAELFARRAGRC